MKRAVALVFILNLSLSLGFSSSLISHQPQDLQCEYRSNPFGLDERHPRLSWVIDTEQRNWTQHAYRIQVAASKKAIRKGRPLLWDTGKVVSNQSLNIPYQGPAVQSGKRYYWRVRVWDQADRVSPWSQPAMWSMGLLSPGDWRGKWIGLDREDRPAATESFNLDLLKKASWIWGSPNSHLSADVGVLHFRREFNIPKDRSVTAAHCVMTCDNGYQLFLNGQRLGTGNNFNVIKHYEPRNLLKPSKNILAVRAENAGTEANPAGLIGLLLVEFDKGDPLIIVTDRQWLFSAPVTEGWHELDYDTQGWQASMKLGSYGMAPWNQPKLAGSIHRRLPARMLRKEFEVGKKIKQATAYICGLGLSELYLNGRKVGDHVLSPMLTDYDKRSPYVTFDVTQQLHQGDNAVGVWLGNGRYYAPRLEVPTHTRTFGFPKLMFQMEIEYSDGSRSTVVSDESWKLTTEGPIRSNCEYDGEDYDARMELPGWASFGFNDSAWESAQSVTGPTGPLAPQTIEPIRVTETIKPINVTQPRPGTYVFDMGQNMVGWCRLKVKGAAGTQVKLRHAEVLNDKGLLYLDNIRSAKVTNVYTCKGQGQEIYEPRFTYHGFRYVELTGYPGKPSLDTLDGRVVHDDLPTVGKFNCSHPLLNQLYKNIVWGLRGNYRSVSTDCPQRDERQGWLGDRSEESRGESYLFGAQPFYSKWITDIRDSQNEKGEVSDVCPNYWPMYNNNVTWPSSYIIIPGMLYTHYGDLYTIRNHYDGMKQWIDMMRGFIEDGIMPKDTYGDWCVPPEEKHLIHSKDPARKTAKEVLGTTYFYHDLQLMAKYARLLGREADAKEYSALAADMNASFNKKYFKTTAHIYDNGSQTSSILPLAFGMVPSGHEQAVFNKLVTKIVQENNSHIGTGLIGGQWLMRTLSNHGQADLGFTMATQTDYPSWGYMIEQGATTIWELWNGDTADPAMNSHNHVMLVGDLITWFYEYLGGIRPDPKQPAFKHIILKPIPVKGLDFVDVSFQSPHGLIESHWQRTDDRLTWDIRIPANTSATVYVPTDKPESIRIDGKPLSELDDMANKMAKVLTLGSGEYRIDMVE